MWGIAKYSNAVSLSREPLAKEGMFQLKFKGQVSARTRQRWKVGANVLEAVPGIVDFMSEEVIADVKQGDWDDLLRAW